MISYYNQTTCFLIVSALRNCNSFSVFDFEMIISYFLYTVCLNFHHKFYVNKDSFVRQLFYMKFKLTYKEMF